MEDNNLRIHRWLILGRNSGNSLRGFESIEEVVDMYEVECLFFAFGAHEVNGLIHYLHLLDLIDLQVD